MVVFVGVDPNTQFIDMQTGRLTRDGFQIIQAILTFYQGANSAAVTTDGVQTLTNKSLSGNSNTFSSIPTNALDNTSGSGSEVVTATSPGTNGTLAQWDGAGNIGIGPVASTLAVKETTVNDTVATVLGSLGAVGSNTTVQGWTVVRDSSNAVLGYSPYF